MIGIPKFYKIMHGTLSDTMNSIPIKNLHGDDVWRANIDDKKEFNVAFFGCSLTYGWGLEVKDTWPLLITKKLEEHLGKTVQCWNFGVPGSDIKLNSYIATKVKKELNPDLIIFWLPQMHRRSWVDDKGEMFFHSLTPDESMKIPVTDSMLEISNYCYDLYSVWNDVSMVNKDFKCVNIVRIDAEDKQYFDSMEKYYDIKYMVDSLWARDCAKHYVPNPYTIKNDGHPNEKWTKRFSEYLFNEIIEQGVIE